MVKALEVRREGRWKKTSYKKISGNLENKWTIELLNNLEPAYLTF